MKEGGQKKRRRERDKTGRGRGGKAEEDRAGWDRGTD